MLVVVCRENQSVMKMSLLDHSSEWVLQHTAILWGDWNKRFRGMLNRIGEVKGEGWGL